MDNDAQDIRLLIRSFVDSLNAFKASLDRHAEIIREYRESREAARQPENPPEPAKIIAELPPAIVSYYEAEQNVRRSAKWWKRVERGLAVLAFFAAVALAPLTTARSCK